MKGRYITAVSVLTMLLAVFAQAAPFQTLSPNEEAGLIYMRQEQKLVCDVYMDLSDNWNTRLFNSIADSELSHMDSMLGLLNSYGIPDPIDGLMPGEFDDFQLWQLYYRLITQSDASLVAALNSAAETEELHIGNLVLRMAQTNKRDIKGLYNYLRLASANHLRVIVSQLASYGEIYSPQHLSYGTYNNIMSAGRRR